MENTRQKKADEMVNQYGKEKAIERCNLKIDHYHRVDQDMEDFYYEVREIIKKR